MSASSLDARPRFNSSLVVFAAYLVLDADIGWRGGWHGQGGVEGGMEGFGEGELGGWEEDGERKEKVEEEEKEKEKRRGKKEEETEKEAEEVEEKEKKKGERERERDENGDGDGGESGLRVLNSVVVEEGPRVEKSLIEDMEGCGC